MPARKKTTFFNVCFRHRPASQPAPSHLTMAGAVRAKLSLGLMTSNIYFGCFASGKTMARHALTLPNGGIDSQRGSPRDFCVSVIRSTNFVSFSALIETNEIVCRQASIPVDIATCLSAFYPNLI